MAKANGMRKWKNRDEFKKEVKKFADKIDIKIKSLKFRPMRNKWASCSTKGNLNFNLDLLNMDKRAGKYVIVHELLHFRVPNHGKLWKSLMRAYLGNYTKILNELAVISTKQNNP